MYEEAPLESILEVYVAESALAFLEKMDAKEEKTTEKLKKTLLLIYRWIYRIIFGYARISLVAVVGIVSAQVVARNIFKSNIRWNQEVALLLTIWMAFLGLSIGVDKGLHIKVELFFSMFPKTVQKALDCLNRILLLLVGVFFTYYGTALILSTTHSKMTVTRWPACVMYLMIPVAGVTMIYFVLMKMLGIEDETDAQKKGEA